MVPKGRRVIPVDRQDRKARRVPTETMVLPGRPAWMALPAPMARKGRRVSRVRLGLKARLEPMDSREDRQAPKGRKVRPALTALKGCLERMAPKVHRGR